MDNLKHVTDVEKAFSNFVMVNKTIVKHFGDFNTAGILGYLIAENQGLHKSNRLDSQGYFWCKADKLEENFGLSRRVQDPIIKKLKEAGLISVETKQVEGSSNAAKIRHFKINHTAIYNLVNGIKEAAKPVVVEDLPDDLAAIRNTLKAFVESKGATFVSTHEDEVVLRIARLTGFSKEISIPKLLERIKKYTNASFNCKYLIKTLVLNFDDLYLHATTPKIKPIHEPLLVA